MANHRFDFLIFFRIKHKKLINSLMWWFHDFFRRPNDQTFNWLAMFENENRSIFFYMEKNLLAMMMKKQQPIKRHEKDDLIWFNLKFVLNIIIIQFNSIQFSRCQQLQCNIVSNHSMPLSCVCVCSSQKKLPPWQKKIESILKSIIHFVSINLKS